MILLVQHLVQVTNEARAQPTAIRAGLNGTNLQGRRSGPFHENAPRTRTGKRFPNRINKSRVPWIILRVALLAAGIAICLWVYLGQFGIHP